MVDVPLGFGSFASVSLQVGNFFFLRHDLSISDKAQSEQYQWNIVQVGRNGLELTSRLSLQVRRYKPFFTYPGVFLYSTAPLEELSLQKKIFALSLK